MTVDNATPYTVRRTITDQMYVLDADGNRLARGWWGDQYGQRCTAVYLSGDEAGLPCRQPPMDGTEFPEAWMPPGELPLCEFHWRRLCDEVDGQVLAKVREHLTQHSESGRGLRRRVKPVVRARQLINIALHRAASRGEFDGDVDGVAELLAPAIAEIEREAAVQLVALRTEIEAQRRAYQERRNEWESDRRSLKQMRERAERDTVAVAATPQDGPLEEPHGYYVYYLWAHDGTLLYIGRSTNVLSRLGQHVNKHRHAIWRITALACPDEETMCRVEAQEIRQHRPPLNIVGTRGVA
jgi:hypothetical protein